MHKIRTYNAISSKGLERFPSDTYRVTSDLQSPDAIMLRSHKLHDEQFPETVKAIGRAGAGVNNIPMQRCTDAGIVVFNAPGANANAVKELVAAGLFLGARDIYQGIRFVDSLAPQDGLNALLEQEKKNFAGAELAGKTLGVVGLGNIGSLVANMGISLSMDVIGYDPAISVEAAWRLSRKVAKMDNLASLFAQCDYISLHLPALDETRGLVNAALLANTKPSCVLLNFARGEIVDINAVTQALDAGQLHRYICDFPTNATLGHPKMIQMPHIGASTAEAEDNCAVMIAEQLKDFLENGNILNSVNFPQISMARTSPYRLTITNKNVPKVLGQITAVFADQNINIVDMLNKSRDDIAYNIVDLDEEPPQAAIDALWAIKAVVNLRLLY